MDLELHEKEPVIIHEPKMDNSLDPVTGEQYLETHIYHETEECEQIGEEGEFQGPNILNGGFARHNMRAQ
jgi:hypothetical protein